MAGQPRIYPNLNPAAALPVDRDQIFRLESFFEQFRLQRPKQHGHYVPNSKYIFVRLTSGETLLHPTFRHPALAQGHPVHYAGEAYFDNGRLTWWSNGSGNYRPDPDHAEQAGLPMDRFFTYDEIQKGRHQLAVSRDTLSGSVQMRRAQGKPALNGRVRTYF
jgi:hypothetical protein